MPEGGKAKRKQMKALRDHVAAEIERAAWLDEGGRLTGIGGTVRNLAAAAQLAAGLPSYGIQGFRISRDALGELIETLRRAAARASAATCPGIKFARGDLILAGALVVDTVMEVGGFGMIEATDAGLREGVFFETLLGDPPLVERRAPRDGRATSPPSTTPTSPTSSTSPGSRWSCGTRWPPPGLHRGDPKERELLWATAMLHDIGTAVDYDDHHKHSRYLILSAGMPGYSPREVALIGQAARYHRKGNPGLGEFSALARPGDEDLLNRIAAAVRIAEQLERSRDQAVHACDVQVANGRVELRLHAVEDVTIARWATERQGDVFRKAFGRELKRQLTARGELVADLEADRQPELLELAHVALERRGLAAEGLREVGRALARVVGDRLQVLVGPLAHPLEARRTPRRRAGARAARAAGRARPGAGRSGRSRPSASANESSTACPLS